MGKARMLVMEQAVVGGTEGGRSPTGVPRGTGRAGGGGGEARRSDEAGECWWSEGALVQG